MSVGDGDCHTVKIDAGPSGGPDRLAPHRLARRVLALEPVGRAAGDIARATRDARPVRRET
jgi:hypothetical protein